MDLNLFWFGIPLVIVVSLVYAATRGERVSEIIPNAIHTAVWTLGFLACVFGVFWIIT
ncbi:MAG: hypothetical protein PHE53_00805 [Thermoguttaceae bacterium]|nr:hypothetical protein [Thermoguttaceae bacterium]